MSCTRKRTFSDAKTRCIKIGFKMERWILLDNKESFNKVGISRNDEPTRFLTEEEMEQLEQARFNYETKVENTPKTTVEKK